MLCYADRTFCNATECERFTHCPRALTDEVKQAAIRWWGNDDPPVALYANPRDLQCYTPPQKTHAKAK